MKTDPYSKDRIKSILSEVTEVQVLEVEFLGGGKNSKVFRFQNEKSESKIAKFYYNDVNDSRNRLETEYESFSYLWEKNFRNIPQPVLKNSVYNLAIYQNIDGKKIKNDTLSTIEVDKIISFIHQLKENEFSEENSKLSPASDACFSISDYDLCIVNRLNMFEKFRTKNHKEPDLFEFIDSCVYPSYKMIKKWCQGAAKEKHISWHAKISNSQKTLSPSDFGFHNALLVSDGKLIFLDFEYFGWDDPAKMISDFLLHPAMNLSHHLKQYFFQEAVKTYGNRSFLNDKIRIVYPLVGLKWSLLLLNEFLQNILLRRNFASSKTLDSDGLKIKQLEKSKKMLQKVMTAYKEFPYCI